MTDTPSSHRQFPRTQVSFDVDVRVDGAASHEPTNGRLVVLSAGGAFLELDSSHPIGTCLRMLFEMATLGEISCRAIVRRDMRGKGVGVEFLDLDGPERDRIGAFIARRQV